MNKKQQKKIDTIVDDLNFKIKVANSKNKNKNGSYIYYTFYSIEIFDVQHIPEDNKIEFSLGENYGEIDLNEFCTIKELRKFLNNVIFVRSVQYEPYSA